MSEKMQIGGRPVGAGAPTFLIAELSANHKGSFEAAAALVEAAAKAGADAVKLQTYTADTITLDSDAEWFRVDSGTIWDGTTLHALYSEAMTPWEWHPKLFELARGLGMTCFSSPFDESAVDFLEGLGSPAYKIASFELVDIPLIRKAASTGKPLVISTGMATLDEVDEAVAAARGAGARELALLVCSSAYPSPPEAVNLRRIPLLRERFGVVAGLSDHTTGIEVPVASVSLGAAIIEKHLTLSRDDGGPDAAFSLEPGEFAAMAKAVRIAEAALGDDAFSLDPAEDSSRGFRRSLFVVESIRKGEQFTVANVRSIRPGAGLHTRYLEEVIGSRAARDIDRGTPLSWELVERE